MKVVDVIRIEMRRANLTVADLAGRVHVSDQTIYQMLNENTITKLHRIEQIAKVLGMPASELIRRAENFEEVYCNQSYVNV